jgi:hypothetical protein
MRYYIYIYIERERGGEREGRVGYKDKIYWWII